ncbi:MAG TPA: M3 family oligoendopeptidase [Halanaerobiales bacterium]|nr:M3 family oligoendopeptidase [Halanaerobiales bacterium]
MEMKWSLDSLYPGFDAIKFKEDRSKFEDKIEELEEWNFAEGNKLENIEDFILTLKDYYKLSMRLKAFSHLTVSVDAKNEEALKMIEKIEKEMVRTTKPMVNFQLYLSEIDNRESLYQESEILAEHKFFIEELVDKSKYLLPEDEEELIAKMKQTGSSAWTKLQEKLTSTLKVPIEIEGEEKELPLPVVRNMAYKNDPEIRRKAYQAELDSYEEIEESVAAALNGIKGEVLTLTERRGYDSPLAEALHDSRLKKETLDALMAAIEEKLPLFREFYKTKAEILGHDKGLPFYDLFAPLGEKEMEFSYQEAKNFILANIEDFSQEMADLYKNAFENQWIDAEPREGKRGGAFCYNLHPIKESRILSNFTGSFSDVTTLAHELGHAYHGHSLEEESIINSNYPMPLAETASILSETIVTEAALEKADQEQTYSILENYITSAGQVIVDIYSRFTFEKNLFKEREASSLSVDELKELMVEAQKKAYGDAIDHNYLHPYMWLNKPHYYSAGNNYYNFPYAFGLLFGLGVYALSQQKDGQFMEDYNELLRATGKKKIESVAEMVDIDVTSKEFWLSSLEVIENNINRFKQIAEKKI